MMHQAEHKHGLLVRIETASAVTGISFKMSTGNIDSGTFTLYGLGK